MRLGRCAMLLLVIVFRPGLVFGQDNSSVLVEANKQYEKNDYRSSTNSFLQAIRTGQVDGISWYRLSYGFEQLNHPRLKSGGSALVG